MADGSLVRFEIGFTGGGATSGQADAASLKALEDALGSPSGAPLVTLESEGTRLLVRTSEVAWLRLHEQAKRVGF